MNRKMIFFTEGHTLSAPGAIDKFWPQWLNGFLKWWAAVGNKSHSGQKRLMFLMMHFQSCWAAAHCDFRSPKGGKPASLWQLWGNQQAGEAGCNYVGKHEKRHKGVRTAERGDCWELCQSVRYCGYSSQLATLLFLSFFFLFTLWCS